MKKQPCKMTDENMETYMGTKWVIGEWHETSGRGDLCGEGWLHYYDHPLLAAFLFPVHTIFKNNRLFVIEVGGKVKHDNGTKSGATKIRLLHEITLPTITKTQRVAFGILCAKKTTANRNFNLWAKHWLEKKDRTARTAAKAEKALKMAAKAAWEAVMMNEAPAGYAAELEAELGKEYAAMAAGKDEEGAAAAAARAAEYAATAKRINLLRLAEEAMTY